MRRIIPTQAIFKNKNSWDEPMIPNERLFKVQYSLQIIGTFVKNNFVFLKWEITGTVKLNKKVHQKV